jgi:excisionase family DNA binding protein
LALVPKQGLDPDILVRARRAADRLRPLAAGPQRKPALPQAAPDPQDVRDIIELVEAMSGQATPVDDEVTPNEAAEILGMSRPSVMRLIANGALHPRMVHSRHKLSRAEVVALAHAQTRERRAALANLAAFCEEFDV